MRDSVPELVAQFDRDHGTAEEAGIKLTSQRAHKRRRIGDCDGNGDDDGDGDEDGEDSEDSDESDSSNISDSSNTSDTSDRS